MVKLSATFPNITFFLAQILFFPALFLAQTAVDKTDEPFSLQERFFYPYTGIAEIIDAREPGVELFDFLEMGQPRFVSFRNLFPWQTRFVLDNMPMNDPLSGMYNSRFVSTDQSLAIEPSPTAREFRLSSRHHSKGEEPYTQLKFLEGDFGYFDLDLFFARPLTKRSSFVLAGYNRGYDGWTFVNAGHSGFNYRAEADYRMSDEVTMRAGWVFNRHRTGMQNFSFYEDYSYDERQNRFFVSAWFADSSIYLPRRIDLFIRHTRRTFDSRSDQFFVRERYDQVMLVAEKSLPLLGGEMSGRAELQALRYWGTVFDGIYGETAGQLELRADSLLGLPLEFSATPKYHGDNMGFDAGFAARLKYGRSQLRLGLERSARLPYAMERFYNYPGISGSRLLNNEIMRHAYARWQSDSAAVVRWVLQGGFRQLDDEIVFNDGVFVNGLQRDWSYLNAGATLQLWMLRWQNRVEYIPGDEHLLSPLVLATTLSYHDRWFDTVDLIATGSLSWYDGFRRLSYNPIIQRFFAGGGTEQEAFYVASFKAGIIVKDAYLFFEMTNPVSTTYSFVQGYFDQFRRIRFGVNWEFWN